MQLYMGDNNKILSNNNSIKTQKGNLVNLLFINYVLEEIYALAQNKEKNDLKVILFCREKSVECESLNIL